MKRLLFALATILFATFLNACISVHSHKERHGPPPPHRHYDGTHHHPHRAHR